MFRISPQVKEKQCTTQHHYQSSLHGISATTLLQESGFCLIVFGVFVCYLFAILPFQCTDPQRIPTLPDCVWRNCFSRHLARRPNVVQKSSKSGGLPIRPLQTSFKANGQEGGPAHRGVSEGGPEGVAIPPHMRIDHVLRTWGKQSLC